MAGGKVSMKPTVSSRNAMTLILAKAIVRTRHNRLNTNHAASQTRIAPVVTPESVPVGLYKLSRLPIAGDASAEKARTPNAAQPMPVARMAAPAGPLHDASLSTGLGLIFHLPSERSPNRRARVRIC